MYMLKPAGTGTITENAGFGTGTFSEPLKSLFVFNFSISGG